MSRLTRLLDPNNLRPFFDVASVASDVVRAVREDASFLGRIRRAVVPLPFDREPPRELEPFGPPAPLDVPALRGRKVALVASGGSGATAASVGVLRAFEEAKLTPVAISASSGAVLFCLLWAAGLDAAQVARFWLNLPVRGYVDPDWRALARSSARAFGGWAGLLRGQALEDSVRARVGAMTLGDLRVPFSAVAWNVDLNRTETFGTRTTPEVEVAVMARVAVSIPIFVEPVRVAGHLYGDGGIVDIFPVRPVLDAGPDLVVGLNSYLPEGFAGEDVSGWHQRPFAILRASGQLRWSGMVALAREQARLAGERLLLLHPVPYEEVRGGHFYETFVDRSRWPDFMRAGRAQAREALVRWRPARRGPVATRRGGPRRAPPQGPSRRAGPG